MSDFTIFALLIAFFAGASVGGLVVAIRRSPGPDDERWARLRRP